ncbi:hypothetical protein SARC_13513 [Sphaeroforma arctica JP610]|uniref:Uncharacterized protein n=1 Tax=Sphaeroforma arctica JP610 TaxID=667725 RepID=A0A0L0FBQ2_9EUKA|nr:hypothetical protein SARC_13513 [Sphaeroforma arctica JP610]KNC73926.1 hypothetical protein SARC_13513 [Sphaeroforma arctica JP610]|eukprot:XP_014147828.1 hypothetical protein SARC_13513 [Sphaeroforma arctica JP610]
MMHSCKIEALLLLDTVDINNRNNLPEYNSRESEAIQASMQERDPSHNGEECTTHFDRDTSTRYYCEDQGCGISDAIKSPSQPFLYMRIWSINMGLAA